MLFFSSKKYFYYYIHVFCFFCLLLFQLLNNERKKLMKNNFFKLLFFFVLQHQQQQKYVNDFHDFFRRGPPVKALRAFVTLHTKCYFSIVYIRELFNIVHSLRHEAFFHRHSKTFLIPCRQMHVFPDSIPSGTQHLALFC